MGNEGEGLQEPAGLPLGGERKLVTILFADISGFTAYSEKTDPEAVRDLINDCFSQLTPIVAKYKGTVEKFIGDEIMAIFGAPMAHENDAERGVLCGLEMMERLAGFNIERGTMLGMHIGINTGLVVAGSIGAGEQQQYGVTGDAVNVAARLADASERGQIIVGSHTWRLTAPLFEFEPMKTVRVKGKAKPVPVYRVIGLKAKPGGSRGLEIFGIRSPLVGRDAELATARASIERLLNGQGSILGIIGEAGLGKSRLLTEIREDIPIDRLYWLEGSTLSFGQTISYWPFQEILRRFALITEDDLEAEAWFKLESKTKVLFPENAAEILPYLASLLALQVKGEYETRVKFLDSESMGKQIFLASRKFFERLARDRPVVLVFEDLQWMDESSTSLLEHLLALVKRAPLLVIGIRRPSPNAPSARLQGIVAKDYNAQYTEILLTPLSQNDSAQLMRNLLEIENLSPRVRATIVSKAEGNPFFLEEVIRALIDTRAVLHDPVTGHWRETAQIESVAIPDTIQGVIMARVDQLDEEVKQILRVASVIGRSFLYRVLRAIVETDQHLDEHIAVLHQVDLIRENKRTPELEYIFKHALTQEATYESILIKQRRALHVHVGQTIEALFAYRLEEFYGLLAYHYAQAESWEKAQEYLLKAGDQAGRIAADTETLVHYQQAMAAYGRAFGDQWEPFQRAVLERKMGEALVRRGEHTKAIDYLKLGLAHMGYPLPASRWGRRWATLRELVQQTAHRLLPGLFLRQTAGTPGQRVEEEMRLYYALIEMAVVGDPELFLLLAFRMKNFCERNGFLPGVIIGASTLGTAADFMTIYPLAGRYHRHAVALADQVQRPDAVGLAYQVLTLHEFYLGEWNAALVHGRRSVEAHRESGNLRGWGWATYLMACILIYQGDYPHAQEYGQELVRFGQDGADLHVLCLGHDVLGFVQQFIGPWEEAIIHHQQAIVLAETVPDHLTRVGAGAKLGQSYLRQRKLQPALDALEASQRLSLLHKEPHHFATLCNALAEAYLFAAEQVPVGKPGREKWMKKAGRACRSALRQGKAFRGRRAEALRLRGRYEWLRGKPAAARKWWQHSLAEAETLNMRYEMGMTHLEIARRLDDGTHLEQAESIFAVIGVKVDPV